MQRSKYKLAGIIKSLRDGAMVRPGGNCTGIITSRGELLGKGKKNRCGVVAGSVAQTSWPGGVHSFKNILQVLIRS